MSFFPQFLCEMKLMSLKRKGSKLYNEKNEEAVNIVNPQIYKPVFKIFQKFIRP